MILTLALRLFLIEPPLCLWVLCPCPGGGVDQREQQAGEQCPPAARHVLLTGGIPARGLGGVGCTQSSGFYLSQHADWQLELPFRICWGRICISFAAILSSLPSLSEFGGGKLETWLLASFRTASILLSAVCVINSASHNALQWPPSSPAPPVG